MTRNVRIDRHAYREGVGRLASSNAPAIVAPPPIGMTSRGWRLGVPLLVLAAVLLPSSPLPLFGGIPLQGWAALGGLILAGPLLFSSRLRCAAGNAPRPVRIPTVLVAVVVIGAKVLLFTTGTHGAFAACYKSLVPPGDAQGCQRSFNDLFAPPDR